MVRGPGIPQPCFTGKEAYIILQLEVFLNLSIFIQNLGLLRQINVAYREILIGRGSKFDTYYFSISIEILDSRILY